jgi:hypothetical protein
MHNLVLFMCFKTAIIGCVVRQISFPRYHDFAAETNTIGLSIIDSTFFRR